VWVGVDQLVCGTCLQDQVSKSWRKIINWQVKFMIGDKTSEVERKFMH
jgi:hypothetical protein